MWSPSLLACLTDVGFSGVWYLLPKVLEGFGERGEGLPRAKLGSRLEKASLWALMAAGGRWRRRYRQRRRAEPLGQTGQVGRARAGLLLLLQWRSQEWGWGQPRRL